MKYVYWNEKSFILSEGWKKKWFFLFGGNKIELIFLAFTLPYSLISWLVMVAKMKQKINESVSIRGSFF